MLRLLIFHPALAPYKVDFFNALAEHFDLTVVFQARNLQSQKFDQEKLSHRVRFDARYMPGTKIIANRKWSRGYAKVIREIKPDVVIGAEFGQSLIVPYLLRPFFRKRYRLWTLTDDNLQTTVEASGIRKRLRGFFVPRLCGVGFANPKTRDWYAAHLGLRASAVVPIIGDAGHIRSAIGKQLEQIPALQKKYQLEGQKVLLYVGRLAAPKNLPLLFEALTRIRPDATLALVGSGAEQPFLESEARRLGMSGRILFVGRLEAPELYGWYQLADVFVLPSQNEIFGAVVGEALQSGCPVVCSDNAGAASIIRPGISGEIADHTSAASFAAAIETVLARDPGHRPDRIRPDLMEYDLQHYINQLATSIHESIR